MKYLSHITLLSCASAILLAQPENVHFERLLPEQGLSSGTILSILQDHKGYLWIGTYEGLNRYDGFNFKVFKSFARDSTALFRDYITALAEDSSRVK